MVAYRPDGAAFEVGAGFTAPLSDRLHLIARGGLFRSADSTLTARDSQIGAAWFAVSQPALTVKIRPRVSIPLGGVSAGMAFTMLSSGSFDPVLGIDVMAGGSWLFVTSFEGRVALYPGFDDVLQGPYGRVDLKGARRIGEAVFYAGLSAVGQRRYDNGLGAFAELSPVAGAVLSISERWSGTAQVRVPVWMDEKPHAYFVAGGVGVTAVVGQVAKNHVHGGRRGDQGAPQESSTEGGEDASDP